MEICNWKYFIRLACLGLMLTLSNTSYAAVKVNCMLGATLGTLGTTTTPSQKSIISKCTFDIASKNWATGFKQLEPFPDTNIIAASRKTSIPAVVNPIDLGSHFSRKIIDMGTTKPDFATCSGSMYPSSATQHKITKTEGHWYCAQLEGSLETGYIFGKFISEEYGFEGPRYRAVDCTVGSLTANGSSNSAKNILIGNCNQKYISNDAITHVTLSDKTDTNQVRTGERGGTFQPNPSYLGYYISAHIIDVGTTKPTFSSCAALDYTGTFFTTTKVDGHWYCVKRVGTEATGYLYGKFINDTLGFRPALALDIDSNGSVDALTDGLLTLRYLFGFTDVSLIDGAVATDAFLTSSADIQAYLAEIATLNHPDSLDIDADGNFNALTDGLLVLRYLFGFRGANLIDGAVATSGAGRTSAADIEAYIEALATTP